MHEFLFCNVHSTEISFDGSNGHRRCDASGATGSLRVFYISMLPIKIRLAALVICMWVLCGTPVAWHGDLHDIAALRKLIPPGRRILYLYGGAHRQHDALELGAALGIAVDCIDIERDASHDLEDIHVWEDICHSYLTR